MKIEFLVEYFYYPLEENEQEQLHAVVSVRIPKEQGYENIPLYCLGKIGDCEIDIDGGTNSGDSREYYVEFYAESPEELNKKIDYAIEQYRKQVLRNIEIVKKIKDRVITLDFPDPYDSHDSDS